MAENTNDYVTVYCSIAPQLHSFNINAMLTNQSMFELEEVLIHINQAVEVAIETGAYDMATAYEEIERRVMHEIYKRREGIIYHNNN